MSRVSPRAARLAAWIAVPAALVASGVVVSTASYSAFSATTTNPTSNWTAGTVALSDDDANTALFTAANLKPGSVDSKCITVTSTGSLPSTVKLYATSPSTSSVLAQNTTIKIEQGTGGGLSSCSGFTPAATGGTLFENTLPTLGTQATNFASGLGAWTTTGAASETRVYRVTYTVSANTPNAAQGTNAQIGLTWEAQNN
ncbi:MULTISPECIES: hypothetical protein [unclassified Curtobacterium]|uniref:hypothetical protein n=1 Tax=unclassified Curtobacterium TaxID=257496 RepID=UPI001AE553C0|nr:MULTISPECIES: hypothetical protein [unclassified Curtobacterium]MDB6427011.1 hypothetical protein [Curtobacterium sp. 20TX0008]MDT0211404.1 hypothetical protein [Curtobacterium sp. BRD11]